MYRIVSSQAFLAGLECSLRRSSGRLTTREALEYSAEYVADITSDQY